VGPLATVSESAWRVLPLKGAPPMTRFTSWVLTQDCTIDISKARRELGYEPVVDREQGLAGLAAAAGG
jgi:nucleoside-diphosphate-sugar epimerase